MLESEFLRINDLSEAYELISKFEKQLTPSLSARNIDIKNYSQKLVKSGVIMVIKSFGDISGIYCGYMNDRTDNIAYCSMIVIDKAARGRRIGRALLDRAEKEAVSYGMKSMRLEVRKQNDAAIKFYKNMGYSVSESAGEDSYYMIKQIENQPTAVDSAVV